MEIWLNGEHGSLSNKCYGVILLTLDVKEYSYNKIWISPYFVQTCG